MKMHLGSFELSRALQTPIFVEHIDRIGTGSELLTGLVLCLEDPLCLLQDLQREISGDHQCAVDGPEYEGPRVDDNGFRKLTGHQDRDLMLKSDDPSKCLNRRAEPNEDGI